MRAEPAARLTPIASAVTPVARWLDEDELSAWDRFVDEHPYGLLYHSTSWKRVLEQAFPHIRGRFLVLADPATRRITSGLPVYTVRSWLLGNRLVSVPFASFCDPLISSARDFELLLPLLLEARQQGGARRLEIRTRRTASMVAHGSLARGAIYKHHILDIDRNPDDLLRTFKKTAVRQMITRARDAGTAIVEATQIDHLWICHEILSKTRRRLALPPMPFTFFEAMHSCLLPQKMRIFLAYHNGRPVACLLILISGRTWIAEHAGDTDEAPAGVNQLLYWEAIRCGQLSGAEAFSFGRTATSNQGLLTYKRRWGTVEEELISFECPPPQRSTSRPGREESAAYRTVRSVIRKAPMSLCEIAGRFCYRHLG